MTCPSVAITIWIIGGLGFILFNIFYSRELHRGCVEFNCTYNYIKTASGQSYYFIIVSNQTICSAWFDQTPINGSICYNPDGKGMTGYLDCPSSLSCNNWDAQSILTLVDIFYVLALLIVIPLRLLYEKRTIARESYEDL